VRELKNVNFIQSAIMQLEGGAFQKLFDAYLYKKYKFKNIQTLGVQTGTNKTTKGTPDSYILTDEGNYILINYGTVRSQSAAKIKADILSCFEQSKLSLNKDKIQKIICGHCSTNIHIEQFDDIIDSIKGVDVELIGVDTLSHDLALLYPHIAKDELGIAIDTNQFFDIDDFVKAYDANGINAPIDCHFFYRESEFTDLCSSINNNKVTILTGPSGIGKTRLAVEACREEDNITTKVFCVKSNGNLLYEDIKYYISDPGRYLIFLDDANMIASLDNVISTILTLSPDFDIRILISVRDYAKDRVIKVVSKYTTPNIIEIGPFKDEEIKNILKSNLGIINLDYLNKISQISSGNIRLAFLAGMKSIEDGFQSIRNAEDIFKNYYGNIIDESKLTREDILTLFFIAISGPVKNNENQLYNDLKKLYGQNIDEILIVENLYSLELVDWFKREIIKISDQSFGNYILYYVLFEKKWVSVENLISIGFPSFKNKIVYALNTLTEIFNSEACIKYIKDSINTAWNNVPESQHLDYLECFYLINPDKALSIIKSYIEQEEYVDFDLHTFDVNSPKKHNSFSTNIIEILGGFKFTQNYEDAIDLLMCYFDRRPDLIMEFYSIFSERFLYDRNSYKDYYNHEIRLLDKLWCYTENGENYNNSILYLNIVEYGLKIEISFSEAIRNSKSINYVRMQLGYTEEIASIRSNIWKNLAILRKREEYQSKVNNILLGIFFYDLKDEELKQFLQSDFNTIYEFVINKKSPDFFDAKIVARYKELAEQIGIKVDSRYMISEQNLEFRIYEMLRQKHLSGRTIDEDERLHEESISKEIKEYDLNDFQELFRACSFLEQTVPDNEKWSLSMGLECVFKALEKDCVLYLKVLELYIHAKTPFKLNGYSQIKYMLDQIGYEETYNFINNNAFDKKNYWLLLIWECIPEKNIDVKIVEDFKVYILNSFKQEQPIMPATQVIIRYGERDSEIKKLIINQMMTNLEFSARFLDYADLDENELIIKFFRNDIDSLVCVYKNALSVHRHMDYSGRLFKKIFDQHPTIWNEYIDWIKGKDNLARESNANRIFEFIWSTDKWRECVEYAFKILVDNDKLFYIKTSVRLLFANATNETIFERKRTWLIEKLRENSEDIRKCKKYIVIVVNFIPDWKLEYIVEFLKFNKNLEAFKQFSLFSSFCMYSGSQIPLIIENIEFLKSLKDKLSGIDYIDHRKYLEDYCISLVKDKDKLELEEYLKNADYA
jgi:hypothetical protein